MLQFKDSVDIRGIRPEITVALIVADEVYQAHGADTCTVTSCTDGTHSKGSLHYAGQAVDLRIWAWEEDQAAIEAVAADLRARLPSAFDVVVEPTHIHVEHQPKEPLNAR